MNYAYNSALCRLYKISFNSFDVIYGYSNLRSIDAEIELRTRKSVREYRQRDCTSHVFSVRRVTCVFFCVFILCIFIYCPVNSFLCLFCYHVYWWNKDSFIHLFISHKRDDRPKCRCCMKAQPAAPSCTEFGEKLILSGQRDRLHSNCRQIDNGKQRRGGVG